MGVGLGATQVATKFVERTVWPLGTCRMLSRDVSTRFDSVTQQWQYNSLTVESEMTMTHLQKAAVYHKLKQAFMGRWFDLGGVTHACKVAGLPVYVRDNMDWVLLESMHCVEWDDMDKQTKVELLLVIARVLGVEAETLEEKIIGWRPVNPLLASEVQ